MNVFLTYSNEVLRKCHIKCTNISESRQNHVYKCDFVLCNKTIGEHAFAISLDEILGVLTIIKNKNCILKREWHKQVDLAIQYSCSYLAVQYFTFSQNNLSCRNNLSFLDGISTSNGSIKLEHNPTDWIKGNSFISELMRKPLFDRIINFVINTRGIYIKKWQIEAQKNYFNTSVNGGLPLVRKKDEIHEGTFMLHDIFHFLFLDPLITGEENDYEKSLYIATRMMGEACTLVLADMIGIEAANITLTGYDTTTRKIHPLFKGTQLQYSSLKDVKKMMYANSMYCLFGDLNILYDICLDKKAINDYNNKYKKFFSGDFSWNEKNIQSIFSHYKTSKEMHKYFKNTFFPKYHYTTKRLAEIVSIDVDKYSFNRLFEVLWNQLEEAIKSPDEYNPIQSKKTTAQKYLSGQLFLRYRYSEELSQVFNLINFDNFFKQNMRTIIQTSSIKEIILKFNELSSCFVKYTQYLEDNEYILPHESFVYKLHVNHFEPEYIYYDNDDSTYEPLQDISSRLIGEDILRTSEGLLDIDPELQNLYFELIKYAK